jgi:hypothetical protein
VSAGREAPKTLVAQVAGCGVLAPAKAMTATVEPSGSLMPAPDSRCIGKFGPSCSGRMLSHPARVALESNGVVVASVTRTILS